MNDSEYAPPSCSETIAFPDGVDAVLDIANAAAGKVTSLMVSDVAPGVVDLHADIQVAVQRPAEHVDISFTLSSPNDKARLRSGTPAADSDCSPCPYCASDNSAVRATYYDQTCRGCVDRMEGQL